MVNVGLLILTVDVGLTVWGTQANFQWVSRLGLVTAPTSLNGGQPNFARCLAVSWAGTLHNVRTYVHIHTYIHTYIHTHFCGLLPNKGILPHAKFTLHPSLAFSYICSVTA